MNSARRPVSKGRLWADFRLAACLLAFGLSFDSYAGTSILVTNCSEASLVDALRGGGAVTLACNGTILFSKSLVIEADTMLDGSGYSVTLSGHQAVRVLQVRSNVNLTLKNVTIAEGFSEQGGGLLNDGGRITALDCQFLRNRALGRDGTNGLTLTSGTATNGLSGAAGSDACGGAVYNAGFFTASNCVFTANLAQGGQGGAGGSLSTLKDQPGYPGLKYTDYKAGAAGGGGHGYGGAIYQREGALQVIRCRFDQNEAKGGTGGAGGIFVTVNGFNNATTVVGQGGAGGDGVGGCVFHRGGQLEMSVCQARSNTAQGGGGGYKGGAGGAGQGAGIYNLARVVLEQCQYRDNLALGGGGASGENQALNAAADSILGGRGGEGQGGACYNQNEIRLDRSVLFNNRALGGSGGSGGQAAQNPAGYNIPGPGGPGGAAGGGAGAGIYNRSMSSAVTVVNSTLFGNLAAGGVGGPGGDGGFWSPGGAYGQGSRGGSGGQGGSAFGGGLSNEDGHVALTNCTLAYNSAQTGQPGRGGKGGSGGKNVSAENGRDGLPGLGGGGGIRNTNGLVSLVNTLVAFSTAGGNADGPLQDWGHNLSSDTSCSFTAGGSLNNVDPWLGALGDYGGPTLSMILLSGSPALGAGDRAANPGMDQRGFVRPAGAALDMGAVEGSLGPPALTLSLNPEMISTNGIVRLEVRIQNLNPNWVISNLTCQVTVPPDQVLTGSSNVITSLSLGGGQTFQTNLLLAARKPGQHGVLAALTSSLSGSRAVTAGAVLQVTAPPETVTEWVEIPAQSAPVAHAVVNPQGTSANVHFEYGSTPTYTQRTPTQALAPDSSWVPIAAELAGLDAGTNYHYRLVVETAQGLQVGPDQAGAPSQMINVSSSAALEAAVQVGGYIRLAAPGTVTLERTLEIGTNTVLDGRGYDVAISGGDQVRVFYVHPGVELTLLHLRVIHGRQDSGAGLFNDQGKVVLIDCELVDNRAIGLTAAGMTQGRGGAIWNRGWLYVESGRISDNRAEGGPSRENALMGQAGWGGAIFHEAGQAYLREVWFSGNVAAGSGGYSQVNSTGGNGGGGYGGAIYNNAELTLDAPSFWGNQANGGQGGLGSGQYWSLGILGWNPGGPGGNGQGGAVFNQGQLLLVNSLMVDNAAKGSPGGRMTTNAGPVAVSGVDLGGGVANAGYARIINCTLADNLGDQGANVCNQGVLDLANTIVASSGSVSNGWGTIADWGGNLSTDASLDLSSFSSRNNVDPRLLLIRDGAGSAPQLILAADSPAIDAGEDLWCPDTDQRGVPRPIGRACDIGAWEYVPPPFILALPDGTMRLQFTLQPNRDQVLQTTTDFVEWLSVSTNRTTAAGLLEVIDNEASRYLHRFYRARTAE